jgi:hypothetical protein
MENFEKAPEHSENKVAENAVNKYWEELEKKSDELRQPTAETKIKDWWDNLFVHGLQGDNAEQSGSKADDNGKIYMVDGKLLPNTTYEINGNVYKTDDKGRIISCESKPKHTPENPRDIEAQKKAGGDDRKPNDQGGHIVGRDMNGDGGAGNLIAMDSRINQSDYKRMENDIKRALDEGKEVTTKTDIIYNGDSERPDKIVVTVTVDGKDTVYTYDNNLDGSLMEKVAENGTMSDVDTVQSVIDETGGQISSVKEEYDSNGNLEKTTVNITYVGDDGKNYRTTVDIHNSNGG